MLNIIHKCYYIKETTFFCRVFLTFVLKNKHVYENQTITYVYVVLTHKL